MTGSPNAGARWIMGTPEEARRRVAEFAAAGVERLMLQDFLPRDLEMVTPDRPDLRLSACSPGRAGTRLFGRRSRLVRAWRWRRAYGLSA